MKKWRQRQHEWEEKEMEEGRQELDWRVGQPQPSHQQTLTVGTT